MDGDLLWAACLAHPADNTARRVFADLLQERGFANLARAFRGIAGRACVRAAAGVPAPEALLRLLFAAEDERNEAIRVLIDEHVRGIFQGGLAADTAAGTNAVAWAVDAFVVEGVGFDAAGCHVRVTFTASGDQSEEHPHLGDSMIGAAAVVVDVTGGVAITVTNAEIVPWDTGNVP